MSNTYEAQKVDTPASSPGSTWSTTDKDHANFKAHPQDTLPPEMWKIFLIF